MDGSGSNVSILMSQQYPVDHRQSLIRRQHGIQTVMLLQWWKMKISWELYNSLSGSSQVELGALLNVLGYLNVTFGTEVIDMETITLLQWTHAQMEAWKTSLASSTDL